MALDTLHFHWNRSIFGQVTLTVKGPWLVVEVVDLPVAIFWKIVLDYPFLIGVQSNQRNSVARYFALPPPCLPKKKWYVLLIFSQDLSELT
jgi:hypothetical protein